VDARIINTTSPSGIFGNVGQANYGAAKAGIAAFTVITAQELGRYGVTCNAIAPTAVTRMTEDLGMMQGMDEATKERLAPESISPIVVWLGSTESNGVTGRVFGVTGNRISVAEGWVYGPSTDREERWLPGELSEVIPGMVKEAAPNSNMGGTRS
jgi:NAD(P)-dependent dehydrogenase (short-subunit alcohol dehydrogenase family)